VLIDHAACGSAAACSASTPMVRSLAQAGRRRAYSPSCWISPTSPCSRPRAPVASYSGHNFVDSLHRSLRRAGVPARTSGNADRIYGAFDRRPVPAFSAGPTRRGSRRRRRLTHPGVDAAVVGFARSSADRQHEDFGLAVAGREAVYFALMGYETLFAGRTRYQLYGSHACGGHGEARARGQLPLAAEPCGDGAD